MAKTAFATNNALTKKAWDERLFRDTVKESYFARFMGGENDPNSIVHVKSDLTKMRGDNITFGIAMRLSGTGVTSGQQLEGQEESLVTYSDSVSLERYRHGVRDNGDLSRQRAMFSIDAVSQARLQDWGSEKIDQLAFDALFTSPTKIFYKTSSGITSTATAATAKAALTAADSKITPALISAIRTWAKTGGNRGQTPLRPVRVMGKNYFVVVAHPDALYDLKNDSVFAQARREALERGPSNPIFSDSVAIWDGVVIHEHENCPIATDGGGASVPWTKAKFMGAQSLMWAWGKRPQVISKMFDYDEEHGYAWAMTAGTTKPQFNSKDYGSVEIYLSRTNIAGL